MSGIGGGGDIDGSGGGGGGVDGDDARREIRLTGHDIYAAVREGRQWLEMLHTLVTVHRAE